MKLNEAIAKIGGITAALGIGNLFDLHGVLAQIVAALDLPEWVLTAPGWAKWPVIGAAIIYALLGIVKTSHTNPDGTDATQPYQEPRDTAPLPPLPPNGFTN